MVPCALPPPLAARTDAARKSFQMEQRILTALVLIVATNFASDPVASNG
jgi:hypothetical protein